MKQLISKKFFVRTLLVTVLIGLLMYSFLGEKQPYNDGLGWDGRLYYQMCNHSLHDITHHGYSTYYVQRFLPFAIVNALQIVFGYEHTMFFMFLTVFVATMIGVWGFFKISDHLKLKIPIEAIAFSFIFFHKGLLRCGYAPYSTDVFALMMGIWFFYFFYTKRKWAMMCIAFIGAFIWQSVWPVACALFALPWGTFDIMQQRNLNNVGWKCTEVLKLGIMLVPLLSFAYLIKICVKYGIPIRDYGEIVPYFYCDTNIVMLVLSIIGLLCYLAYLLYPVHFDLFELIKDIWKKFKTKDVIVAVLLFAGMYGIVHAIADTSIDVPYTFIFAFRRIMWEPLTFPLKFLEGHLLTFGLTIIFVLIYFKQLIRVVQSHSYGYLFAMIYIIALGCQTEVRFIINMLPFVVFAVAMVMNELNYKSLVAPIVVIVQLYFSHFWYHINTPEILATTITEDDLTYLQYPLQRMFQYSGPWQSPENYYKWISIFAILLITIYILHRTKLLYDIDKS